MSQHGKGNQQPHAADRTSVVVGAGMAILTVIGVATVLGEALGAALAPPPAPGAETALHTDLPQSPAATGPTTVGDAGGGKS